MGFLQGILLAAFAGTIHCKPSGDVITAQSSTNIRWTAPTIQMINAPLVRPKFPRPNLFGREPCFPENHIVAALQFFIHFQAVRMFYFQ